MQGYQGTSMRASPMLPGSRGPSFYDTSGRRRTSTSRASAERADWSVSSTRRPVRTKTCASVSGEASMPIWSSSSATALSWDVLFGQGGAVTGSAGRGAPASAVRDGRQDRGPVQVLRVERLEPRRPKPRSRRFGPCIVRFGRAAREVVAPESSLCEQVAGYHMAFAWIGLEQLVARARGGASSGQPAPSG